MANLHPKMRTSRKKNTGKKEDRARVGRQRPHTIHVHGELFHHIKLTKGEKTAESFVEAANQRRSIQVSIRDKYPHLTDNQALDILNFAHNFVLTPRRGRGKRPYFRAPTWKELEGVFPYMRRVPRQKVRK